MASVRRCVIRVDGEIHEDLYDDLIAVEVCDRAGEPSSFALQIAIFLKEDGTWTRLDETAAADGGFSPWQRVTIALGFEDRPDVLIDGYVAGVAPHIAAVETDSHLLVWGYDASHTMDVEEKIRPWPDTKYSDVATAIFQEYGLTPDVTDTMVVHAEVDSLLIQRGTDWQFLKQLAERVGFEVFVRGGTGYFKPQDKDLSKTPQRDLAAHFGPLGTNLIWFEPRMVGHLPGKVTMARTNAVTKSIEKVEITDSPLKALGKKNGDALRSGRSVEGKAVSLGVPEPLVSEQAMEAWATGLRRRADWMVTGEGELDGTLYGRALRAAGTVLIKGVGKTFSGVYYVTEVIHRVTPEQYTQRFKVVRNGVELQGSESFQGADVPPDEQGGKGEPVAVRSGGQVVAS